MVEGVPGPKKQLRSTLESARSGSVAEKNPTIFESLKIEIYGISAYFIEKVFSDAQKWLQDNPNRMLIRIVEESGDNHVVTEVREGDEIECMSGADLKDVMERLAQAISGLGQFHVQENMYDEDEGVTRNLDEENISAQKRLGSLLSNVGFREGRQSGAEDFILSATNAPATIIPAVYYAGMYHFMNIYERWPKDEELDQLIKKLDILVMKMTNVNIFDISDFISQNSMRLNDDVVVDSIVSLFEAKETENGIEINLPELEAMRQVEPGLRTEDTLGCPAMYAKIDGVNVVRFLCDYAKHLLKKSSIYQNN